MFVSFVGVLRFLSIIVILLCSSLSTALSLAVQTFVKRQNNLSSTVTTSTTPTTSSVFEFSSTIELVTTITDTTPIVLEIGADTDILIQGPTTLSTNFPVWYSTVDQVGTYFVSTFAYVLTAGTRVLQIPVLTSYSTVTLTGPTDYLVTYTQIAGLNGNPSGPIAGNDTSFTCTPHSVDYPNQYLTYATQLASLTAGQTSVVDSWWAFNETLIGPTVVAQTQTYNLYEDEYDAQIGHLDSNARCQGVCGVFYWPVANPNTACLGTDQSTLSGNVTFTASTVQLPRIRGLTGLPEVVSTFVSNDFTFTSPSIYIAFETVSAIDSCGIVGSPHYSTTLSFAPEDVSTLADLGQPYREGEYINQVFSSFNFADADCPPQGRVAPYSIVGQTGYSPVISPPAGLNSIDLDWLGNGCRAVQFQGNDPPHAILPQSNLDSFPTSIDPPITTTTASPSSAIPSVPAKTTPISTPQETTAVVADPAETSISLTEPLLSDPSIFSATEPDAATVMISSDHTSIVDTASTLIVKSQTHAPDVASMAAETSFPLNPTPSYSAVRSPITQISSTSPAVVITFGNSLITANAASAFIIGSQTLTPGGEISVQGTPLSVPESGSYILEGTSTIPLNPSPLQPGALTFAGHTFTQNTASNYIINGQTLVPGQAITVFGTPISLESTPTAVIIGGSTQAITSLNHVGSNLGGSEIFASAEQTPTRNPSPGLTTSGKTIAPGQATATASGTTIISASSSTLANGSSTQGLASLILNGFGDPGQNITPFTGMAPPGALRHGTRWLQNICITIALYVSGNCIVGL